MGHTSAACDSPGWCVQAQFVNVRQSVTTEDKRMRSVVVGGVAALAMALLAASGAVGAADDQVVDVVLGSYYIKPETIRVKAGQPVTLKVTNEASVVPHDLVIDAPAAGISVKVSVAGGKTASTTFTPTQSGRYEMYCSKKMVMMKSHKDKGMVGTLEVSP